MKVESLIPASWFYRSDSEKTKFNWFLYEYACKLFEHIDANRSKRISDWKAKYSEEQIAAFCAYYSKRMKRSVIELLEADSAIVKVYDDYLTDYCHDNIQRENHLINKIAVDALDDLFEGCGVCPTQCLRDRFARCELFDRMERGGYLS